MMRAADLRTDALWEDAGRRVAARLDQVTSAVVVGRDPRAVALAALGIGRSQSARRRVAVADLIGESEPLQSLVTDEDVHGIVDSFVYGISFNRIARPVQGFPNLFILPSGSEPMLQEELFRHPRWRRLSGGFQEVGALLLLAVTDESVALDALIGATDGAIVVGTDVLLGPDVRTLATVVPYRPSGPLITPERGAPEVVPERAPPRVITPERVEPPPLPPAGLAAGSLRPAARRYGPLILGGAVIGLGAAVLFSTTEQGAGAGSATEGSRDELSAPAAVPLPIANPSDSLDAASWSVRVVAHNTEAGALRTVAESLRGVAALTYAPVILGGNARWYQVYAGAHLTRAGADSMLAALRDNGNIARDHGQVVERPVPLAFRLAQGLDQTSAPSVRDELIRRGVPAYTLLQEDGTATVFAGAFEDERHAALAATTIRSAVPEAELVFRTGRP